MARSLEEQITSAKEEIRQKENRLKELRQKHKAQERKARTHRICTRGGHIESRLPETIALTDEQFFAFIDKTMLTKFSRDRLDEIISQSGKSSTPNNDIAAPNSAAAEPCVNPAGAAITQELERQAS